MKAGLAALAAAAALAACGGGPSSVPAGSVPLVTPAPGGAQQTIVLPSAGGYGGTMLLTFANSVSSVSADVSLGTSPPPGAPAPAATSDQALIFIGFSVPSNIALAGFPAFTFTVPSAALQSLRRSPQSGDFNVLLNFFDPGNAAAGYQTGQPCAVSGVTITCTGGSALFNLLAQLQYVFELVLRATGPIATPPGAGAVTIVIPTPSPVLCAPAPVAVTVGQTAVITCNSQDTAGPFSIAVANPAIASAQQFNAQDLNVFKVTGVAPGTTTLSLQSVPGGTGSVAIVVAP
jgi:hypothetical protein